MKLDQEELQRKSEQLKEQKIKQIKDNIRTNCLILIEFPEEIENIIISYSFDESKIETNYSLRAKVNEYCMTENEYLISELDVSCVTSMNYLFVISHDYVPNKFNQPLDKWDTSNVVDMRSMFYICTQFNQAIDFNTKNVIDMSCMFCQCYNFNQAVNFDTRNVISMSGMFSNCSSFNQPVNFDTKNVLYMVYMFCKCQKFNQPVDFDTKNVINMEDMFYGCENLEEKNKKLVMH